MKLLTKLRELRTQNSVDQLFEDFHFSVELHRDEAMGIGTTTYDDIQRLNISMSNTDKAYFIHK
jgi:hypothetical protein